MKDIYYIVCHKFIHQKVKHNPTEFIHAPPSHLSPSSPHQIWCQSEQCNVLFQGSKQSVILII